MYIYMCFRSLLFDFSFFQFSPVFYQNIGQIRRVEELSDAYHLTFGDDQVMVIYLLEVVHRKSSAEIGRCSR